MKELLEKSGYKETEWENEWTKDNWTIRVYEDEIEVFNEPRINTPGIYHKCETTFENLKLIIEEVDKKIK